MNSEIHDSGMIILLMKRLEEYCLPKALRIKEKVDQGELLDDLDIDFLEEIFSEISESRSFIKRHPECERLAANMMELYMDIADRAMLNEKQVYSSHA